MKQKASVPTSCAVPTGDGPHTCGCECSSGTIAFEEGTDSFGCCGTGTHLSGGACIDDVPSTLTINVNCASDGKVAFGYTNNGPTITLPAGEKNQITVNNNVVDLGIITEFKTGVHKWTLVIEGGVDAVVAYTLGDKVYSSAADQGPCHCDSIEFTSCNDIVCDQEDGAFYSNAPGQEVQCAFVPSTQECADRETPFQVSLHTGSDGKFSTRNPNRGYGMQIGEILLDFSHKDSGVEFTFDHQADGTANVLFNGAVYGRHSSGSNGLYQFSLSLRGGSVSGGKFVIAASDANTGTLNGALASYNLRMAGNFEIAPDAASDFSAAKLGLQYCDANDEGCRAGWNNCPVLNAGATTLCSFGDSSCTIPLSNIADGQYGNQYGLSVRKLQGEDTTSFLNFEASDDSQTASVVGTFNRAAETFRISGLAFLAEGTSTSNPQSDAVNTASGLWVDVDFTFTDVTQPDIDRLYLVTREGGVAPAGTGTLTSLDGSVSFSLDELVSKFEFGTALSDKHGGLIGGAGRVQCSEKPEAGTRCFGSFIFNSELTCTATSELYVILGFCTALEGWDLVFHHDISNGVFAPESADFATTEYGSIGSDFYSRLNTISQYQKDDGYTCFRMSWRSTSDQLYHDQYWCQDTNPVATAGVDVTVRDDEGYGDMEGLCQAGNTLAWLVHCVDDGWFAIGSSESGLFNGKLPGPRAGADEVNLWVSVVAPTPLDCSYESGLVERNGRCVPSSAPATCADAAAEDSSFNTYCYADDLVAYYPFNEGEGNIAHDLSGYGSALDLTFGANSGISWVEDGGLEFTGAGGADSGEVLNQTPGSAAKVTASIKGTQEYTTEAWFSASSSDSDSQGSSIVSLSTGYQTCMDGLNFELWQKQSNFIFRHRSGRVDRCDHGNNDQPSTRSDRTVTGFFSQSATKKHVVVTYKAGTRTTYVDGELVDSNAVSAGLDDWSLNANLRIGGRLQDLWTGKLYKLAIFKRALEGSEVENLYESGSGDVSGCRNQKKSNKEPTWIGGSDPFHTVCDFAVDSNGFSNWNRIFYQDIGSGGFISSTANLLLTAINSDDATLSVSSILSRHLEFYGTVGAFYKLVVTGEDCEQEVTWFQSTGFSQTGGRSYTFDTPESSENWKGSLSASSNVEVTLDGSSSNNFPFWGVGYKGVTNMPGTPSCGPAQIVELFIQESSGECDHCQPGYACIESTSSDIRECVSEDSPSSCSEVFSRDASAAAGVYWLRSGDDYYKTLCVVHEDQVCQLAGSHNTDSGVYFPSGVDLSTTSVNPQQPNVATYSVLNHIDITKEHHFKMIFSADGAVLESQGWIQSSDASFSNIESYTPRGVAHRGFGFGGLRRTVEGPCEGAFLDGSDDAHRAAGDCAIQFGNTAAADSDCPIRGPNGVCVYRVFILACEVDECAECGEGESLDTNSVCNTCSCVPDSNPASCEAILADSDGSLTDGSYWIDPKQDGNAMLVDCKMSEDEFGFAGYTRVLYQDASRYGFFPPKSEVDLCSELYVCNEEETSPAFSAISSARDVTGDGSYVVKMCWSDEDCFTFIQTNDLCEASPVGLEFVDPVPVEWNFAGLHLSDHDDYTLTGNEEGENYFAAGTSKPYGNGIPADLQSRSEVSVYVLALPSCEEDCDETETCRSVIGEGLRCVPKSPVSHCAQVVAVDFSAQTVYLTKASGLVNTDCKVDGENRPYTITANGHDDVEPNSIVPIEICVSEGTGDIALVIESSTFDSVLAVFSEEGCVTVSASVGASDSSFSVFASWGTSAGVEDTSRDNYPITVQDSQNAGHLECLNHYWNLRTGINFVPCMYRALVDNVDVVEIDFEEDDNGWIDWNSITFTSSRFLRFLYELFGFARFDVASAAIGPVTVDSTIRYNYEGEEYTQTCEYQGTVHAVLVYAGFHGFVYRGKTVNGCLGFWNTHDLYDATNVNVVSLTDGVRDVHGPSKIKSDKYQPGHFKWDTDNESLGLHKLHWRITYTAGGVNLVKEWYTTIYVLEKYNRRNNAFISMADDTIFDDFDLSPVSFGKVRSEELLIMSVQPEDFDLRNTKVYIVAGTRGASVSFMDGSSFADVGTIAVGESPQIVFSVKVPNGFSGNVDVHVTVEYKDRNGFPATNKHTYNINVEPQDFSIVDPDALLPTKATKELSYTFAIDNSVDVEDLQVTRATGEGDHTYNATVITTDDGASALTLHVNTRGAVQKDTSVTLAFSYVRGGVAVQREEVITLSSESDSSNNSSGSALPSAAVIAGGAFLTLVILALIFVGIRAKNKRNKELKEKEENYEADNMDATIYFKPGGVESSSKLELGRSNSDLSDSVMPTVPEGNTGVQSVSGQSKASHTSIAESEHAAEWLSHLQEQAKASGAKPLFDEE